MELIERVFASELVTCNFDFHTFTLSLHQVGLVPNVVFDGHLAAAGLGLLAFIAVQVAADTCKGFLIPSSMFETMKSYLCVWYF